MDRSSPLLYTILVGTMTGTAELVAEEIDYALQQCGAAAVQIDMYDATPAVFRRPGRFLICCSTYGDGQVPDNAQGLYAALIAEKPDLEGVQYAVFGLGDHAYAETFGYGGKKFDALLESLGATRLIAAALHDASGDALPEEAALEWLQPLLEECAAAQS